MSIRESAVAIAKAAMLALPERSFDTFVDGIHLQVGIDVVSNSIQVSATAQFSSKQKDDWVHDQLRVLIVTHNPDDVGPIAETVANRAAMLAKKIGWIR